MNLLRYSLPILLLLTSTALGQDSRLINSTQAEIDARTSSGVAQIPLGEVHWIYNTDTNTVWVERSQLDSTGTIATELANAPVEPRHFGATPYASEDTGATIRAAASDHVALQAWLDAHKNFGAVLHIPGKHQYKSTQTLNASSKHPPIELDGTIWFSKVRTPGIILTDERTAAEKLEGTLRHRFRLFRDAGTTRTDPFWLTYDYAETSDGATNGGGETMQETLWAETDIGLQCVAVKESDIEFECRNFAIGCAIDTDLTQGTNGFSSRSHFKPTVMYNNKVDHHIRARGANAWCNEISVGQYNVNLERSTLTTPTKSVYGFVVSGDPAVVQSSRHVPDGINLLGSFENTNHISSPESIAALIVDGSGIDCHFRNDLGTLKMVRVLDELRNRNITLHTEKFHGYDQVELESGGDFFWDIKGRTRESSTLVEAKNVRQLIVPNNDLSWRIKGPHLAFHSSTPQQTILTEDLAIVDASHIDNYDSPARPVAGIGAMIQLGESRLGGYIQVHPIKNDTGSVSPGRITVYAYDSAGSVITPDAGANWAVRDCADSPGALSTYSVALVNTSVRPFDIANDRSYRLRFASNVAKVFIAVSSDALEGFTMTAVDYPGCEVIRQNYDGYLAEQAPTHGIFTEAIEIRNEDPSAAVEGWRITGTNYPLLGSHTWAVGMSTVLGKVFKVNPAGDCWEITTVGGTALTVGTAPTGTGPTLTDANGNEYTKRVETAAIWHSINAPTTIGSLYVTGGAATQANVSTLTPVTQWTTVTVANGTTPDAGTDDITIDADGTYCVDASISFSGSNSKTYIIGAYIDDVLIPGSTLKRKLGTGGDVGSGALHGVFTATAGDVIDIQVSADTGDFLVEEGSFTVTRVGN